MWNLKSYLRIGRKVERLEILEKLYDGISDLFLDSNIMINLKHVIQNPLLLAIAVILFVVCVYVVMLYL